MVDVVDHAVIDAAAAFVDADVLALRRDLHRSPELAGEERRTAATVAQRLLAAGLTVSTEVGGHGVVAVLDGAEHGPTVAYRADLDAVATDAGAAHLCGHDLHAAIGVGIAEVLARLRSRLRGRVMFLFQPAEETLAGARAMIDAGVLDRTRPDEVYALHCAPLPVGVFGALPGVGQPGLDVGHIELTGPNAATTADRLVAEINDLSTVRRPETPDEFAHLLDALRTPDGPLATFVVAGADATSGSDGGARADLWLRTWPDDAYPALRERIRGLAASVGARVDFPAPPFPAMVCSAELSYAAAAHVRGVPGVSAVEVFHAAFPFNGEDFALFLQQVPGAMLFLGVANPAAGINGVPHAPDFAADERAIGLGVRAMAALLLSRLHELSH